MLSEIKGGILTENRQINDKSIQIIKEEESVKSASEVFPTYFESISNYFFKVFPNK